MGSKLLASLAGCALVLTFAATAYAQEAVLTGTVTDSTGGVLPGVIVVAVHQATGNTFEAVTDGIGVYRVPVRIGNYELRAQLPGFTTVTRTGVNLLVGQEGVVNFQLSPSAVQETVMVTGEAPLINITSSSLGGNIDTLQLSELPVNGRNWMDLTLLAPGNRRNAVDEVPGSSGRALDFQLNIDGQQVTQMVATGFGQPRLSRDAIAEFEFISNRFDATQGRSHGVQVNAITKSGTNTASGSFSGYFRDDSFNAADFIQQRVLPYSNQQMSGTFGGPIRRDRIHFFGNYEYEREPLTFAYDTPYPSFNIDQEGTRTLKTGGARFDFQFSPRTHLTVRGTKYVGFLPFDPRYAGGATRHPSAAHSAERHADQLVATLTHVLSSRAVNEIKAGYAGFYWDQQSVVSWSTHPAAPTITRGAPQIQLRGFRVGQEHANTPQKIGDEPYSIRDNFTYSFNARGRHDLQVGGEYIHMLDWLVFCNSCMGFYDAQGGPIPANIETLFPVWNDVTTWNLAPLSPLVRRYTVGLGNFRIYNPRDTYAAWVQNDWQITPRLTLNLGLRYDVADGVFAEYVDLPPFLTAGRPIDTDNVQPRVGFAYAANDQTVVRGGYGKFYADISGQPALWAVAWSQQIHPEVLNDGRPDFAANPFNGPLPTFEQLQQTLCSTARRPGCVRPTIRTQLISPDAQIPYSHQASVGVQRQVGDQMAVDIDYVFSANRHDIASRNINLTYDPATGTNRPFTNLGSLPFPDFGAVSMDFTDRKNSYQALQTAFRKRFGNRWQASATYTLAGTWDEEPLPINTFQGCKHPMTAPGVCDVPVNLTPDLGGEWTLAAGDQRHRAVFNGIWDIGFGFQLSGLYFYGSGERLNTTFGGDTRLQGLNSSNRVRPDGTIVPRNDFVGEPLHRVDVRLQQRIRLGARASVDGLVEVFNLFNRENFGSWVTVESNRNFGRPTFNNNQAYQPRIVQLGFRVAF
jgi:hypothetical protein